MVKRVIVILRGMGDSYVLGNKQDENEILPFRIPEQFFKGNKVQSVRKPIN